MLIIGLTGNVAAGKSTVAACFAEWGATVIDADRIVRELQQPGTPVFRAILARFGPDVVAADGTLDRAALRTRVLADPLVRRDLEGIVHPAVAAREAALVAEAQARGDAIAVLDIPLLFETGQRARFDRVVLVDAPAAVRRDRLRQHRGLAPDEADRLLAAQAPAAVKRAASDWVVDNAGDREALRAAAWSVWQRVLAEAAVRA